MLVQSIPATVESDVGGLIDDQEYPLGYRE